MQMRTLLFGLAILLLPVGSIAQSRLDELLAKHGWHGDGTIDEVVEYATRVLSEGRILFVSSTASNPEGDGVYGYEHIYDVVYEGRLLRCITAGPSRYIEIPAVKCTPFEAVQ